MPRKKQVKIRRVSVGKLVDTSNKFEIQTRSKVLACPNYFDAIKKLDKLNEPLSMYEIVNGERHKIREYEIDKR